LPLAVSHGRGSACVTLTIAKGPERRHISLVLALALSP
jgi:hypothetical protein